MDVGVDDARPSEAMGAAARGHHAGKLHRGVNLISAPGDDDTSYGRTGRTASEEEYSSDDDFAA